jgi:hypothetical protein
MEPASTIKAALSALSCIPTAVQAITATTRPRWSTTYIVSCSSATSVQEEALVLFSSRNWLWRAHCVLPLGLDGSILDSGVDMVASNMKQKRDLTEEGEASYHQWRENLRNNPQYQTIYEEEAAKSALWLLR